MGKITISEDKTTILWEIEKGVSESFVINKSDGWAMYDEIQMDFKYVKLINSPAFLSLSLGNGLTRDGTRLIGSLTDDQTASFQIQTIQSDIKTKIGSTIGKPIPVIVTVKETVTKIQ